MLRNNLNKMFDTKINITNFIGDDQPSFVECSFFDASIKEHVVQDKVRIEGLTEFDILKKLTCGTKSVTTPATNIGFYASWA